MNKISSGKFRLSRIELYYHCLAKFDFLDKQTCSVKNGSFPDLNKLSTQIETTSLSSNNQNYHFDPVIVLELVGRQKPAAQFCKGNFFRTANIELTLRKGRSLEFFDLYSNLILIDVEAVSGLASFFSVEKLNNLNLGVSNTNFLYTVRRGKPQYKLLKTYYLPLTLGE